MPKWFASSRGRKAAAALSAARPAIKELYDIYNITRPQATIIQRVAELMGEDPYTLMADLNKADATAANAIYRQFVDRVNQTASMGDKNAAKIKQMIDSDQSLNKLTGSKLKEFAGLFEGSKGAPFSPEQFKFNLIYASSYAVE